MGVLAPYGQKRPFNSLECVFVNGDECRLSGGDSPSLLPPFYALLENEGVQEQFIDGFVCFEIGGFPEDEDAGILVFGMRLQSDHNMVVFVVDPMSDFAGVGRLAFALVVEWFCRSGIPGVAPNAVAFFSFHPRGIGGVNVDAHFAGDFVDDHAFAVTDGTCAVRVVAPTFGEFECDAALFHRDFFGGGGLGGCEGGDREKD